MHLQHRTLNLKLFPLEFTAQKTRVGTVHGGNRHHGGTTGLDRPVKHRGAGSGRTKLTCRDTEAMAPRLHRGNSCSAQNRVDTDQEIPLILMRHQNGGEMLKSSSSVLCFLCLTWLVPLQNVVNIQNVSRQAGIIKPWKFTVKPAK